jgi:hypothetical protein
MLKAKMERRVMEKQEELIGVMSSIVEGILVGRGNAQQEQRKMERLKEEIRELEGIKYH